MYWVTANLVRTFVLKMVLSLSLRLMLLCAVVACQAVSNIVKSSLGPVGLDKVLVELAELQDREVGDGTTSVVILAGDLLKVVDAVQAIKMTNARGEVKYPIRGIDILKAHGKSAKESYLLNGYALNTGRAAQGMPIRVAPARIAHLDFNLQKTKMQLGVQVLVTDPREFEKICLRSQYDKRAY